MKTLLTILILSAAFVASAGTALDYYPGAYWTTKAPEKRQQEAGRLETHFLTNGVAEIDVYWDRDYRFTAAGEFTTKNGVTKFSAHTDIAGPFSSYFVFRGTLKDGLIVGTWDYYDGSKTTHKGKWQATR